MAKNIFSNDSILNDYGGNSEGPTEEDRRDDRKTANAEGNMDAKHSEIAVRCDDASSDATFSGL